MCDLFWGKTGICFDVNFLQGLMKHISQELNREDLECGDCFIGYSYLGTDYFVNVYDQETDEHFKILIYPDCNSGERYEFLVGCVYITKEDLFKHYVVK